MHNKAEFISIRSIYTAELWAMKDVMDKMIIADTTGAASTAQLSVEIE